MILQKDIFTFITIHRSRPLKRERLEQRIEKLRQFMDRHVGKDEKFGKTYQEYFHLHYSKQGIFLGADERTDVIERELQLCGYFCIITSEKMTASQALIQYKGRDISEKLFNLIRHLLVPKANAFSHRKACHLKFL